MVDQLFFIISHTHSTPSKFTSHTVPSKPSNLVHHTHKVPLNSAPTTSEHHGWLCQTAQTPFSYDDKGDCTPSPDPQQQSLLHSPSIQPGEKCLHSDHSDCETEEVVHKAHKINEKLGQPKAHNYNDVAKEIILQAATIYHCLLSIENGFPELVVETKLVKLAREDANKESGMSTLSLTPDIVSCFL